MVERIKVFVAEFWGTFSEMSPFLLFGFGIAGVLSVLVSRDFFAQTLGTGLVAMGVMMTPMVSTFPLSFSSGWSVRR